MNFDGLDPGMGEYPPSLHGALDARMESSLDPHLNPALLQGVELDPEGLAGTVPEPVHLMEGMFSELHSVVSEVGIPVTATHFDLQEEMLWMGNHRVRALTMNLVSVLLSFSFIYFFCSTCSFFSPRAMSPLSLDQQWIVTLLSKRTRQMTYDTSRVWKRAFCFCPSRISNATLAGGS